MKHEQSISAVIPVYQGELYIRELHRELEEHLSSHFSSYEIIYVDDRSPDGSAALIHEIAGDTDHTKAISLKDNVGQQMATFCGLGFAEGDVVVTIDDDGQYAPEDIIRLYDQLIGSGHDCVYGIPVIRSTRLIRRLGTYLTDRSICRITGKDRKIGVSSFRIMRRSLVDEVLECDSAQIYLSVEIMNRTKRVGNLPIRLRHQERATRYTLGRLLKAFGTVHGHTVDQLTASERFHIGRVTASWGNE